MSVLRFDAEQHFTCGSCTRCCRNFDIVVTPGEAEALRHPAMAALWSAAAADPGKGETEAGSDPVEPIAGQPGAFRLRRRADGACGFLASDGACRIHAEHGAGKKPLTCQIFPFRFHPAGAIPLVTASFCCPTIVTNTGSPVGASLKALSALGAQWQGAFPEVAKPLQFTAGRLLTPATAVEMRGALLRLLDQTGPDGRSDLRSNVARMAALLEDWTRLRVLKLEDAAFADYVALTGRFAATSDKPAPALRPSLAGRLMLRGFLLAAVAARLQAAGPRKGLRIGLRWRLIRAALHLHGLWPPTGGLDRSARRRVRVDLEDPAIHALVRHFLRSTLETLPTGRRPLVDELALAFATLDAALALGAMRAAQAGHGSLQAKELVAGLVEAAGLGQTSGEGTLARMLRELTGGLDALRAFAGARP